MLRYSIPKSMAKSPIKIRTNRSSVAYSNIAFLNTPVQVRFVPYILSIHATMPLGNGSVKVLVLRYVDYICP
jgi:hypothetical protein